jgi:hypothetical protein
MSTQPREVIRQTPASDSYREYHIKELQDINYAAVYLEVHLEEHEPLDIETNLLKLAFSNVAEALEPEQLATHTATLEIILQKQGTEAIYGLADWLKGLGLNPHSARNGRGKIIKKQAQGEDSSVGR